MITFGLTLEQAKKVVELDAVYVWNTKIVRDVPSLRHIPVNEMLQCRQEFIDDKLSEYLSDQCAFETEDEDWLYAWPNAFDIIVGAA